MVKNNIEVDIKVKCAEEQLTQAKLAERIGTPASYVNKLIRRDEGIVNNTYVKMLEALGYDIELKYVKREE
ncbi:Helix-turn-helix [Eubacterium ruminantium]|uniref:Helix-turn-helix n=1 Tax=Eubacterium ruminantium TaxID=42322 RepID=A0A1T4QPN7_9FIRM|nr:helix-turn-helix transcriptional regulator [Eubacterium ruminantium]SCW69475.1 Helix-turn-helix [Eubacterium ruminantium]SDN43305.1 Helix-turn-helix [Eubacterium ruminantium]SKA05218.1 Helix-turn-helix [Eubacterium ruminantium]